MFNLFGKRSDRSNKQPKPEEGSISKPNFEGEVLFSKDMLKNQMKEAYSTEDTVTTLMEAATKKKSLYRCILEILEEDDEIRRRYKTEFLRKAITEKYASWFLDILSKGEFTDDDILLIDKAVKDAEFGGRENAISVFANYASDEGYHEFYRVFSGNEKLRGIIVSNIEYFVTSKVFSACYFKSNIEYIVRFFPELLESVIKAFFNNSENVNEKYLLYMLQFTVDSRYLMSEEEFAEIKAYILDKVQDIIYEGFRYFDESYRLIWLLEEEFDVMSDAIYEVLEVLYEEDELVDEYSEGLEYMDDYMMTKAGYELMKDKCYEIAADYPEHIFELCDRFPEEDEAFLFRIARNPNNELLRAFM